MLIQNLDAEPCLLEKAHHGTVEVAADREPPPEGGQAVLPARHPRLADASVLHEQYARARLEDAAHLAERPR
jgi:hypothetical protein